jgi:hypothetical protein
MNQRAAQVILGIAAFAGAAYGAYVYTTWSRYGRRRPARPGESDPLLDRFMPDYEIADRHHTAVDAPADVTYAAACEMNFEESRIVRTILKGRELLLRGRPSGTLPRGLLAKTKALGWGMLAEVPGREIVMGAVTQPWMPDVVFRAFPPEEFASFCDPGYVKIAWTLRADPVAERKSIFRTETRVLACGPVPRSKFRKYWAFLSPGVILIRLAMLGPLKCDAERRFREMERLKVCPAAVRSTASA